jgi:hypothetical protein
MRAPDPDNPAAPIPVSVSVTYDGRVNTAGKAINGIVFREGGEELAATAEMELTVPGEGLFAFIIVAKSEIERVELRTAIPPAFVPLDVPSSNQADDLFIAQKTEVEDIDQSGTRLLFRRVDASGKELKDVELPMGVLEGRWIDADAKERSEDLDEIFRKLPNGHYRVYLQDIKTQRLELIREIHFFEGRTVPADFREKVIDAESNESPSVSPANQPSGESTGEVEQESSDNQPQKGQPQESEPQANNTSQGARLRRRLQREASAT